MIVSPQLKPIRRSVLRLAFCLLAFGLSAGGAGAQEQSSLPTGDNAGAGQEVATGDGQITRDQVLAIMSQEVVLAPGVGLRNIRLGEPLEQVQNRLGPPAEISRSGIISNIVTLNYVLDAGTVVAVAGRDIVERIIVRGNSAGLVRTAQGARFGMDPNLILRIYREPSKSRRTRLEYEHRGITFRFEEGVVAQMELYPRKR